MFKENYLRNVTTLRLNPEACTGCGACVMVCPHAVFEMAAHKAVIRDADACMECGACRMNCPAGAIAVKSGVGCAAGIITGALRGTEPTCDCGCSSKPQKSGRCC